jgi:conjugative transposon TraM protein
MQNIVQNPVAQARQRKFLLVLPVLVFPFLTFMLWSVGVFTPSKAKAQGNTAQKGFNMHLPDAKPKDNKSWNKLDFYQQADADSAKMQEAKQQDPFFQKGLYSLRNDTGAPVNGYHDPNVDKVNQQLAKLNAVLNQQPTKQQAINDTMPAIREALENGQVNKLENMVQAIHQQDTTIDPQMQQLNTMMDKILDIQHPERMQALLKEQSMQHKQEVYAVTQDGNKDNISVLQARRVNDSSLPALRRNAFYSLDENLLSDVSQNSIPAVVQETQTLVAGATVKLRLLNDVYINGILVPKDCFVYGVASLSGERLNINISTIRYQNAILPVSLSVYDLDGMSGIFIPGAITRDVAKQSADEATQGIGLTTLDPSLGAQAASAGIQAAKSLIGKKIRLIKVTIKAGYQVLLKDNNNKQ